ncbi:MAG: hypothetical protein WA809_09905, partial [Candidatus Dormiibacterota bacterium]
PGVKEIRLGKDRYLVPLPKGEGTGPLSCALVSSSLPLKRFGTVRLDERACVVTFTPLSGLSRADFSIHYTVKDKYGLVSAPATETVHAVGLRASPVAYQTVTGHCACGGFWWVPFFAAGALSGWLTMVWWLRRRYGDEVEDTR